MQLSKLFGPRWKALSTIRHRLASSKEPAEEDVEINDIEDVYEEDFLVELTRSLLNSTLCALEVSSFKVHSVKVPSKTTFGKRKQ